MCKMQGTLDWFIAHKRERKKEKGRMGWGRKNDEQWFHKHEKSVILESAQLNRFEIKTTN